MAGAMEKLELLPSPTPAPPPADWMMEDDYRSGTKRCAEKEAAAGPRSRKRKRKTKVVVRVRQEYIDRLLANPPRPFRGMPQELLDNSVSKHRESLRALMAHVTARHKKAYDKDMDILEQYRRQGFAEEVVEVVVEEDPAVWN